MLHTLFFVTDERDALATGISPEDGCISLLIRSDENPAGIYRYCSERHQARFSLTIAVKGTLSESFLEAIVAFLFLPHLYQTSGKRVIALAADGESRVSAAQSAIISAATAQGINNLMVYYLRQYEGADHPVDVPGNFLFLSTDDFLPYYTFAIEKQLATERYFFIQTPSNDARICIDAAKEIERRYASNNSIQYGLAVELRKVHQQIASLEKNNAALQRELNNYKEHMEVLRSNHQAKELQDYYTKEYEILPRWYKQVGHIIKVVLGRRRFQSLFSDRTKKYKD